MHFAVQQNLTQHCKSTIFQLKKKNSVPTVQRTHHVQPHHCLCSFPLGLESSPFCLFKFYTVFQTQTTSTNCEAFLHYSLISLPSELLWNTQYYINFSTELSYYIHITHCKTVCLSHLPLDIISFRQYLLNFKKTIKILG